jgi:hypothetical protein
MPGKKRSSVKMKKQISSRDQRAEIPFARVRTAANASRFIETVGFCVLFPVQNIPLPSLYFAVARRSDARWDKYAQLIWKWKDELPKKRRAFYGKYFKGRGSFLSLKFLPYFLAMQGTAVQASEAEEFYKAGRIGHDALALWQALAKHGALATLELRHACKMETQAGNKRFKKAMLELQGLLIVTHSGAEQETDAWASNCFDLVARAFPEQVAQARKTSVEDARTAVAVKYRTLYPTAAPAQIARLFGWTKAQAVTALAL